MSAVLTSFPIHVFVKNITSSMKPTLVAVVNTVIEALPFAAHITSPLQDLRLSDHSTITF